MQRTASLVTGALVAAAVSLGGYALWSTTAPAPAIAQGAAIDTALYDQVSQLQTRIQHLENQFRQRSTIPMPFRVVDNAGLELATIQRGASGLPELQVGPAIIAGYVDGRPAVRVVDGSRQAGMRIEGDTARLIASSDGVNGFVAESSPNGQHLASIYAGGNEVANLGTMEGRRAGVRFFDAQSTLLAALALDSSGTGQLRATDPDGVSGVTIGGDGHGGGNVVLWKSGQETVSLRTPTGTGVLSVYNNGGRAVGFITTTPEGAGLVTVNDSAGTEVVHFTVRGTGGSFCSRMRNGNAVCLLPLP
jgi:hypothetical protein